MQNEITTGFRLSPQQKQVWLTQQAPACSVGCSVWIEGRRDTKTLAAALVQIARRHEILRTTFRRPAGMKVPLQVIDEAPRPGS